MEQNNSSTAQCPAWCVEDHSLQEINHHSGASFELNGVWNRDIGDGNASASLRKLLIDGKPGFYLSVEIEAEFLNSDFEACASELERLAQEFRNNEQQIS